MIKALAVNPYVKTPRGLLPLDYQEIIYVRNKDVLIAKQDIGSSVIYLNTLAPDKQYFYKKVAA